MNLYLILRRVEDHVGFDEYGGFVVAGETPEAARVAIDLCGNECPARWDHPNTPCVWHTDATTCELIGTAAPGITAGVQLASFNAG